MERIVHNIPPVFDGSSRVLVLGSFPSVKSREGRFFYHHPQNRFWKVAACCLGTAACRGNLCEGYVPAEIEEKREFLLTHGIAVWDVIESCEITGSSDSSIKNAVPNDLSRILRTAPVERIGCNGTASYTLYGKYLEQTTKRAAVRLPSTSPANAAWSLERLVEAWKPFLAP